MQDQELIGDTQSFIVRIWRESDGHGKDTSWRGLIIHVGSGKRVYFHNLNSIKRFVQERTGMGEKGALSGWLKSLISRARQKQG
jgi:hypothetical protein